NQLAKPLLGLREQVVELRTEGKTLPDSVTTAITALSNLRKLSLSKTSYNAELIDLSALPDLLYLILTCTGVGDEFSTLLAEMKRLKNLYLYNTNVSAADVASLKERNPELEVDLGGYDLPFLVTDTLVYRR